MNQTNAKIYDGQWYSEPQIYDRFSVAEDRDDVCLGFLKEIVRGHKVENPIDLASGTGRLVDYIRKNIGYSGVIYAIENEEEMRRYLEQKYGNWEAVVVKSRISRAKDHPLFNSVKSSLIVSRFGFPSKIWDKKTAWEELESVYALLKDEGLFVTFGWDEEFNDELNIMFYKHIPDGIQARNFEAWRKERQSVISSPRNTHLKWYKTGIETSLRFDNLQESAFVMGTLFGDNALKEVVWNEKTEWQMKMSITLNTKESIKQILKGYER
jgi:phospholipid N-methyltransferase